MKSTFLILFLTAFFSVSLHAQHSIQVSESMKKVNKIPRTGLGIEVQLDDRDVEKLWKDELKNYGKVRSSGNEFEIEVAQIPPISSTPVRVYSIVEKKSNNQTIVWWSIDMGDGVVQKGSSGYGAAEKILEDFAKKAYREDIQEQIDDAEKALEKTAKDHEKTVKEGSDLKGDLEDNVEEKADLEQKLRDNAAEKIQLEKDIEQNKKNQAAAEKEVEKMKKALDLVKSKMQHYK